MWYTHTIGCHSAITVNKLQTHATTKVNFENMKLSERNQLNDNVSRDLYETPRLKNYRKLKWLLVVEIKRMNDC